MAKITKIISAQVVGEEAVVVAENDLGQTLEQRYPLSDSRAQQLLDAANEFIAKQEKEAEAAKEEAEIQAEQAGAKPVETPMKPNLTFFDAEVGDEVKDLKEKTDEESSEIKTQPTEINVEGAEKIETAEPKKDWKSYGKVAIGVVLGVAATGLGLLAFHSCGKQDTNEVGKGVQEAPVFEVPEEEKEDQIVEVTNLTADDVRDIANNAIAYLNDDLGLNIAPDSIQAVTYMMNQRYINPEEGKELIDSGFIPDDARDMMAASLPATSTINRNNAMATERPDATIVDYSIFTRDPRTLELTQAFYKEGVELQRLCAILESSTATKEEKEAAKASIEAIWTSFEAYGGLNEEKTNLPMDHVNSTYEGAWVSLQELQIYSAAAAKAGVSQARINFASGEGRDSSVVFVDFSTMYNTTEKNLGLACNGEYTNQATTR